MMAQELHTMLLQNTLHQTQTPSSHKFPCCPTLTISIVSIAAVESENKGHTDQRDLPTLRHTMLREYQLQECERLGHQLTTEDLLNSFLLFPPWIVIFRSEGNNV
jgi:hypothetical protein